jgi:hypothetical protein
MLGSIDPLYSLSGFVVGLLVGQTGMGGGALMTPLLILMFGVNPVTAVGTDLLYASVTKTVGTLVHGVNHTVQWRIVGLLAVGSVPATALTLLAISEFDLSGSTAAGVISRVLGMMLLLTSLSLLFRRKFLIFAGGTAAGRRTAADEAADGGDGCDPRCAGDGYLGRRGSTRRHRAVAALPAPANGDHRRFGYRTRGAADVGGRHRPLVSRLS